jgi:hypothetical protein
MIEKHPLSDRLLKGEWWRYPAHKWEERKPTPDMIEADRLWREQQIREVEERRRRRETEGNG